MDLVTKLSIKRIRIHFDEATLFVWCMHVYMFDMCMRERGEERERERNVSVSVWMCVHSK